MSSPISDANQRMLAFMNNTAETNAEKPKSTSSSPGLGGDNGSLMPMPDRSEYETTAPSTPLRSKEAVIYTSPSTGKPLSTPDKQKTLAVNPNTPNKPIPTAPEKKCEGPYKSHSASFFDKENKDTRKLENSLKRGKEVHSILVGESPKKDIGLIQRGQVTPDTHGVIRVPTSNGQHRIYKVHSEPEKPSVIPIKGPGILPLTGQQLLTEWAKHKKETKTTFEQHLLKNVKAVNKRTRDNTALPSEPPIKKEKI